MIHHLKNLHHHVLNIIAPPFCLSCKFFLPDNQVLCAECRKEIKPVISKTVQLTKTKEMPVLAIGAYEPPLKSLILAKSRSNRAVSYQLGKLVWDVTYVKNSEFDIIVPVPLHWTRYAWRGYNQAEVIAQYIAEQTGKPMVNLLQRIKRTPYQSDVRGDQRIENVKNIFKVVPNFESYKNKRILLVDDLMTTGATLKSAGRELLKLKPEKIVAVVAARVI